VGETCTNCVEDCGPKLGDGVCHCSEVNVSVTDCPDMAVCGDGVCVFGETPCTCTEDCGPCTSICGDQVCDPMSENECSCPDDCGKCPP